MNNLAIDERPSGHRAAVNLNGQIFYEFGKLTGEAVRGRTKENAIGAARDRALIGIAKPGCRFNQRVEHSLEIKGRATDDLEDVGGGGLLLERFAQLVQQPRIFDSDDGLGGEVLDELDLLVGEWQNFLSVYGESADHLLVL